MAHKELGRRAKRSFYDGLVVAKALYTMETWGQEVPECSGNEVSVE